MNFSACTINKINKCAVESGAYKSKKKSAIDSLFNLILLMILPWDLGRLAAL